MSNSQPKRRKNGGKFPQKKSNRRVDCVVCSPKYGGQLVVKRRRDKQLHPSIFQKDRWVVTAPDLPGNQSNQPQVFLSEGRAMSVAAGIANNHRIAVEVAHQIQNKQGEWIEVEE